MAVRSKLTTKGFEKYLENIAKAGRDVDASADRALLAGGELLQDGMIRRAPELTGNLKGHIKIKGPEQEGNFHSIEVGVIHDRKFTDEETARYANAQEYGTSSMGAQPYVRPTLDEDKRKARKAMKESLEKDGVI